ncbi:MAG: RNA-binding S4 domain-containing protein, partial [Fuerstiella sp.]|nr:RNA-binding S4 domain-containing protein [Fuerstiella sp.]
MSEEENTNDGEETIQLDQFLKLADLVGSGGEAKHVIRSGVVMVNGKE